MLRVLLFVLLVGMPITEIAVFLLVGGAIGALPTIAIIIVTAALGAYLLKRQGISALARLRTDMDAGRVPAGAIGHAVTIAIAGVLLLTPGFITDTIGFLLFVPGVRRTLWRQIAGSVRVHQARGPGGEGPFRRRTHARTIELDRDDYRPNDPPPR